MPKISNLIPQSPAATRAVGDFGIRGTDMTQQSQAQTLRLKACELAEEIRDGRWRHLSDLSIKPAPACKELIDELKSRCPGFKTEEYQQALANGLFETR